MSSITAAHDGPPLTFADLVGEMEAGCKPRERWRCGTEHEKFGFHQNSWTPVAYDEPHGIRAMLQGMQRFDWQPVEEGGHLIALGRQGASITLEPGGQFELSGAPLENLHETCRETGRHLREVKEVADELGLGFIGLGYSPLWRRDQVPIMPKGRYVIMRRYMPLKGDLGLDMMLRTCTVQANLDYASEADMVKKFRVSLALQPIATALFANSPFKEGKPSGFLSTRANVWTDTDPDRTGMLDFVFREGFSFETYAEYALNTPMYFVYRDGRYIDVAGQSFRDFMDGRLPGLPGERPTLGDWQDHLTTLFPEVRMKRYLEMRGADAGPWEEICALPALWTGLLYDDAVLEAAWDLVKDWDVGDYERLRRDVTRTALKAKVAGRTVQDVAKDVVALASEGLQRRARLAPGSMVDERVHLKPLEEIAGTGLTQAERLLERYHVEWGGDVTKVFEEFAY